MDFKITIDDPAHLAGLTWAREQSNTGRSEEEQFTTDDDYLIWVIKQALTSYADGKGKTDLVVAVEAANAGDLTKFDAVRATLADKFTAEPAIGGS